MIIALKIVIQHAPLKDDPREWVMDMVAQYKDGKMRQESWASETYQGCLTAIAPVTDRFNLEESYA